MILAMMFSFSMTSFADSGMFSTQGVQSNVIGGVDGPVADFDIIGNGSSNYEAFGFSLRGIDQEVGGTITGGPLGWHIGIVNAGVPFDRLDTLDMELELYDVDGNLIDTHQISDTKVSWGTTNYYWMIPTSNTVEEKLVVTGVATDAGQTYYFSSSTVRWNFAGGSYGSMSSYGGERHHCPANSVNGLTTYSGPAIRMLKEDHARTASYGSSAAAVAYRSEQKALIQQGKFEEAMQMDIDDIRSLFGSKYNDAIDEMVTYAKSKGYI